MKETQQVRPRKKAERDEKTLRSKSFARKFLIVFLFLVAQALFYFSDFFILQNIYVFGNSRLPIHEILKTANLPMERNIVTLPLEKHRKNLLTLHRLKSARMNWSLPGSVNIFVEERTPVILVKNEKGQNAWYACDDEGIILYKADSKDIENLPRVILRNPVRVAGRIPADKVKTIKKIDPWISADLRKDILFYYMDNREEVTVYCRKKENIFKLKLGKADDMNHKMEVLGAFLELLEEKKVEVEYIDLRYDAPVIKPLERKTGNESNSAEQGQPGKED